MCEEKVLILASASPRRAAFLREAGVRFLQIPADIDEKAVMENTPEETVKAIALKKAEKIFAERGGAVLAADSAVVLDGKMLGKPADEEEAKEMLRALSGRTHAVVTGVAFVSAERAVNECVRTEVDFNDLTEEFIAAYVATGSPLDKAGAYGIQDGGLAKTYRGSYSNIVGLPMEFVSGLLEEEGFLPARERR